MLKKLYRFDRIAEYDMKPMDIDSDTLGIPETEYEKRVTMLSSESTCIVRRMSVTRLGRKAFGSPVRERLLMAVCYFDKVEERRFLVARLGQ